jgi:NitT/TauT family transport system substrate-binding protein
MQTTRRQFIYTAAAAATALATGCGKKAVDTSVLRIGFFPNITHAQGMVGYEETATKGAKGWFESRTGVKIEWVQFNAGPSAIEALFADAVDATYVGPNPVLNGYIKAKGADVRVLAGAARGGVALVIQGGSGLKAAADFRGKTVATPDIGNTQDIAARAWLKAGGLKITTQGGDALVRPAKNPDQLNLFKQKEVDAVWTVEPWVSRLELEGGGERLVTQDDTFITLLAASVKAINAKGELLKKFVAAHEELTAKITKEPDFAKPLVSAALVRATTKEISAKLLDHAWPRLKFSTALDIKDFEAAMADAKAADLLPKTEPLDRLLAKL